MSARATPETLIASLARHVHDAGVLDAIRAVPRDRFVPEAVRAAAWEDRALAIGDGQTISQPLIVALMTEAAALTPTDRVLEVGTGSGYQAAVLARLARAVVSVERLPHLQEQAARVLTELGVSNVRLERAAPDVLGFPAAAPYDAILVTAGAPDVPRSLLDQLALGGRLVIPVGRTQPLDLAVITRTEAGFIRRSLGPCGFVPLIGPDAWPDETTWMASLSPDEW
jgi:protein-L-isoaspartate(D-aspartate) O-methyltransferase